MALTANILPGQNSIYINFPTRDEAIEFRDKVIAEGGQASVATEGKQAIVNKLR